MYQITKNQFVTYEKNSNFVLISESKGKAIFGLFQEIERNLYGVVATGWCRRDKVGARPCILSLS